MLSVPVSFKQYLKDGIDGLKFERMFNLADYRVTGIRYYYDNTVTPQIIFTEKGYNSAAALLFFSDFLGSFSFSVKLEDNSVPPLENTTDFTSNDIYVSFDIPDGSFAFSAPNAVTEAMAALDAQVGATPGYSYTLQAVMSGKISQKQYDYYGGYYKADMIGGAAGEAIQYVMGREQYAPLSSVSNDVKNKARLAGKKVILSPEVIMSFMYGEYFENAYTQASLFFGSDGAAHKAAQKLNGLGYVAVPSDATNLDDGLEALLETILLIFPLTGWIFAIIFIALFLSLCTSRAMLATKGDIAIMRSMGIATKVIKLSVYVQNLLALIPAYLFTAAVCTVVFTVPKTNGIFMFLHGWQYLLIASSLLAISLFLAKRHTKKMFSDSVKKTLKGSS